MIFQASEVVQLSGMGVAVMIQQMSRNLESFFNCYMQDGIEKKNNLLVENRGLEGVKYC